MEIERGRGAEEQGSRGEGELRLNGIPTPFLPSSPAPFHIHAPANYTHSQTNRVTIQNVIICLGVSSFAESLSRFVFVCRESHIVALHLLIPVGE